MNFKISNIFKNFTDFFNQNSGTFDATAFYENAFSDRYARIWGSTPFLHCVKDLSFVHSLVIMNNTNNEFETERRKLLYYYAEPYFGTEKSTDIINRISPILPSNNRQIKRVISTVCNTYANTPSRTIKGQNEEKLIELISYSDIDTVMNEVHQLVKLSGECLLRPLIIDGELEFEIITKDNYEMQKDNLGRIESLYIYRVRFNNQQFVDSFDVWTKDSYKVIDSNNKVITPEETNIYGEIPYILVKLNTNNIYNDSNEVIFYDLLLAQLDYNLEKILIDNTKIFNSFPIIALFNFKANLESLRPGKFIVRNDITDGEVLPYSEQINPQAQYTDLNELQKSNLKQAMKNYEMPNTLIDSNASVQSGISLQLERIGLEEYRQKDVKKLKKIERELINLIAKVANIDGKMNFSTNKDYEVDIDYVESAIPSEADKEFALLTQKFEAGLIDAKNYLVALTQLDTITNNDEAITYINDNLMNLEKIKGRIKDEQSPTI